jgi:UDP:flavonoid glycosyltransferase YjiC (YdhE family)
MAAGVPIVGVGLQMEQQINLDHVMDAGAGMRIQMHRWRAPVIRRAVGTILADPTCRARAGVLAEMIRTLDGPRTAADRMWEFLLKR